MAISQTMRKLVGQRDEACWHCGRMDNLVYHHRQNRGSGGSKLLDRPSNLLLICAEYNISIESYLPHAREARDRGIKISRYDSPLHTPLERFDKRRFLLDDYGKAHEITEPF